jgi:conjugal transfer/entry exclusion protein
LGKLSVQLSQEKPKSLKLTSSRANLEAEREKWQSEKQQLVGCLKNMQSLFSNFRQKHVQLMVGDQTATSA